MTKPAGWIARAQNLGSAYLAVLRAEVSAALADLAESGRGLLRAVLLFTVALALGFWTVGLLVYFLIEMLALRLPRWGAVGIVFGLFVLATVLFAVACVARARRIEAPTAMLDRRFHDHARWWQTRIAGDAKDGGASPGAVPAATSARTGGSKRSRAVDVDDFDDRSDR